MKNNRIAGMDVARALAVVGMVIVHFRLVIGSAGNSTLSEFAQFFEGKAAATFVVLAGMGIAQMFKGVLQKGDNAAIKKRKHNLIKRALLLFLLGLSYIVIWPADILHCYGIYILLLLPFIGTKEHWVLISSIVLVLLYPFLMLFIEYGSGWDFATMEYSGFWTLEGFFRNLFYNGYNPVMPWAAFMMFGYWLGRLDLNDGKVVKKIAMVGTASAIVIKLISVIVIGILAISDIDTIQKYDEILGTHPMPPLPIYMFLGMSFSSAVIAVCIILTKRFSQNFLVLALQKAGRFALTFYLAHVVIGIAGLELLFGNALGSYSIQFSLMYALLFCTGCIIFANVWLKYFKQGPIEYLFKKLSS